MAQVVISEQTLRELEAEKTDLQRQIAALNERLTIVARKIEAIPLFLPMNGSGNQASEIPKTLELKLGESASQSDQAQGEVDSPRIAVYRIIEAARRPMAPGEIRNALESTGYPTERLGRNMGYFYTVLMRLTRTGHVEKQRGKYMIRRGGG